MKIFQKIKRKLRGRAFYLVYYRYQNKEWIEESGTGNAELKAYPKISSHRQLRFIREKIQETFAEPQNMEIVIKNIIRLD